jgi:hypothetical protein
MLSTWKLKSPAINIYILGTIHYLWLGVGWQKKGVGDEVFLTEKGGAPKNISSEGGGGSSYLL